MSPRFACFSATPFCQVAVPVFWNRTVSVADVPGMRVGQALSPRNAEWKLGVAGGSELPVLPAVVKSHSLVVMTLFTLMSNRT